jgi:hypothetical protein
MAYGHLREKRKTFFVDRSVLPQTVAVVKTRAAPFGINVVVGNVKKLLSEENGDKAQHKDLIGVLLQVSSICSPLLCPYYSLTLGTLWFAFFFTVSRRARRSRGLESRC